MLRYWGPDISCESTRLGWAWSRSSSGKPRRSWAAPALIGCPGGAKNSRFVMHATPKFSSAHSCPTAIVLLFLPLCCAGLRVPAPSAKYAPCSGPHSRSVPSSSKPASTPRYSATEPPDTPHRLRQEHVQGRREMDATSPAPLEWCYQTMSRDPPAPRRTESRSGRSANPFRT